MPPEIRVVFKIQCLKPNVAYLSSEFRVHIFKLFSTMLENRIFPCYFRDYYKICKRLGIQETLEKREVFVLNSLNVYTDATSAREISQKY